MKLNAPKQNTFWIALVIAIIAVIAYLVVIPVLSPLAFWIAIVAFVLLALGNFVKGL